MSRLRIRDATKRFTDGAESVTVFEDLELTIEDGEFVAVMGPSGCGKTTVLDAVAGLVGLDTGTVELDGEPVVPGEASIGYVFQEPRLLEWRTAVENVRFALAAADVPAPEQADRAERALDRVGLGTELGTYPLRLSGGQRQRINLARALAIDPAVLLMDEPFSSLDEVTARSARRDLLDLWTARRMSVLFVTHDIGEAVALADRVVFMDHQGRIFHEAPIPHERPRDFDDPALHETEAQLTRTFFAELE